MSELGELQVIESRRLDFSFADEVVKKPGGEHLHTCSSCGTCTATCLVRRVNATFNPRLMILKTALGFREEVLSGSEIWECSACDACYPRCPKKIHISGVFRAIRDVAIEQGYERHGVPAQVNVATCVACGMCVDACPYHAIELATVPWNRGTKMAAQVSKNLCLECGICNAVCPSSSISVQGYADQDLYADLVTRAEGVPRGTNGAPEGMLAILCNWCLHSNVDAREALQPPAGVQVMRVPCAGRVSPQFILTSLQRGASGVLVVGCREGECHYIHGSDLEARRFTFMSEMFEMLGMGSNRVRFARLGSLDRGEFGRLVDEFAGGLQGAWSPIGILERNA